MFLKERVRYNMLNQYFGHYLLNKGILNNVQLSAVLDAERSVKVKLGLLAINAGLMTAAQVEDIHHLQRTRDQRFGDLAVEMGFLTSVQVDQLLASQREGHLSIMQVITDRNYMTLTAVENALNDFREEYGITISGVETENETAIIKQVVDLASAGDKADLLYNYVGLIKRNAVRFLDDPSFIFIKNSTGNSAQKKWLVSQNIVGDITLSASFLMEESVLLAIATRFYGEKLVTVDELALDSVSEFLNVNNGVFCSSLSERGLMTDLQPPIVIEQNGETGKIGDYCVNTATSFGNFEIILSLV